MENNSKYFLAANSCEGFVSHFKSAYNPDANWRCYIIKGGPGTGKSTFMKYIAVKGEKKGLKYELCPCSSDPDSLDAVIFPEIKTVIMDGTSPHTVDPDFPAVCETILNFAEFWDEKVICQRAEEILSVTKKNKALHKSASRYLRAAGSLFEDNYNIEGTFTQKEKVKNFANGLCKKYIPKTLNKPYEWVRFLTGVTPDGVVSYSKSITDNYKNIIVIDDEFAAASNIIMEYIRNDALSKGYEIITVKNPFVPSLIIDHILIPELSLSIVREYEFIRFSTNIRRIHSRRFVSQKNLHILKERLKFNKKAIRQLLFSAAAVLKEAKAVHDDLEKYYINAMNFEKLTKFTEGFSENIFK
ncbi:MAG: hypothetical protein IJD55_05180 [Clostridia bacterium]|nr:hypothetical protein [Clostridia bacterium]